MRVWVGVDLGEGRNYLAIVDRHGDLLDACSFDASRMELAKVRATIARHARPRRLVPILVESPAGPVVDWLAGQGYEVRFVHPKASASYRRAHAPSGAKSDVGDARMLANLLRTDMRTTRLLPRNSPALLTLRARTRRHSDLLRWRLKTVNRLIAALKVAHPAALALMTRPDNPKVLAFLESFPTSLDGSRLSTRELDQRLKGLGFRRFHVAAKRYADHVGQGGIRVTTLQQQLHKEEVESWTRIARAVQTEIIALEAEVAKAFAAHPWHDIVASFPAAEGVVGARILSEVGDDLATYNSARALQAFAGTVPVTMASGSQSSVHFRRSRNVRLNDAIIQWAGFLVRRDETAAARYAVRRCLGDGYSAACRNVGNYYLGALYAALRDQQPFDPRRVHAPEGARSEPVVRLPVP